MSFDRNEDHILSPEPRSGSIAHKNAEFYRRFNASNIDLASPVEAAHEDQKEIDGDISGLSSDEDGSASLSAPRRKRVFTLSKAYTQEEEDVVVKKFDRRLVLFLAFLYLLSFLDRSSMHIPYLSRDTETNTRRHWKC